MPILHAIVLGLTQGLSEFLPISSSGHLLIVPWLLGWDDFKGNGALNKSFDVALHVGTLVAVVAYFGSDLVVYVRDGLRAIFQRSEPITIEGRLAWLLVASAIPGALVGAVGQSAIDEHLGQIPLVAVMLIVFGLLLGWADRLRSTRALEDFNLRDAVIIGIGQAIALQPGVSRSGATMTVGRARGLTRDAAARASFLMAIPITAGAVVYKLTKQVSEGVPSNLWWPLAIGVVTSGVSGWFAVWGTLKLVRTRSFTPFVVYRVVLGVVVLILAGTVLR